MFFQTIDTLISEHLGRFSFLSEYILFALVIALSYVAYFITSKYITKIFSRYVLSRIRLDFDKYLTESKTIKWLSFIIPLLILKNTVFIFPSLKPFIISIIDILLILLVLLSITSFFRAFNNYYETKPISRTHPIKGYVQIASIILFIIGVIIIVAMLTGQPPLTIIGGLGAMTAVLLLIFRDTILGFVTSLQISGYDLVRKGDWIEMPKYGANGSVIDISLHTISIQNWDMTITTIPTGRLIEEGFKNWRGMQLSGGRRITRSINIDITSIKFCTPEMIEQLSKIRILSDYIRMKKEDIEKYNASLNTDEINPVNKRSMTNIGTFRAYINAYLEKHSGINHNMLCMVRQLAPGAQGLPLELYAFTSTTAWTEYENIQSDIFDHLIAIMPVFELRVFQSPSGADIRELEKLFVKQQETL